MLFMIYILFSKTELDAILCQKDSALLFSYFSIAGGCGSPRKKMGPISRRKQNFTRALLLFWLFLRLLSAKVKRRLCGFAEKVMDRALNVGSHGIRDADTRVAPIGWHRTAPTRRINDSQNERQRQKDTHTYTYREKKAREKEKKRHTRNTREINARGLSRTAGRRSYNYVPVYLV